MKREFTKGSHKRGLAPSQKDEVKRHDALRLGACPLL
jgi:hypothetical protein